MMSHNSDQLPHLIKMANQIAANQPADILGEAVAVEAVASHIQKFWAPEMRRKIANYLASDGGQLDSIARQAVARLG